MPAIAAAPATPAAIAGIEVSLLLLSAVNVGTVEVSEVVIGGVSVVIFSGTVMALDVGIALLEIAVLVTKAVWLLADVVCVVDVLVIGTVTLNIKGIAQVVRLP